MLLDFASVHASKTWDVYTVLYIYIYVCINILCIYRFYNIAAVPPSGLHLSSNALILSLNMLKFSTTFNHDARETLAVNLCKHREIDQRNASHLLRLSTLITQNVQSTFTIFHQDASLRAQQSHLLPPGSDTVRRLENSQNPRHRKYLRAQIRKISSKGAKTRARQTKDKINNTSLHVFGSFFQPGHDLSHSSMSLGFEDHQMSSLVQMSFWQWQSGKAKE